MKPLISVIVPVYKVELYLAECVDSILAQTYQNLEIILVDDGSPDGCPDICEKYMEQDSRVQVIHKENGGLSDARNVGIEAAKGEYIGFVDSDDWIAPDMYERMASTAQEYAADVVVCEYYDCWKSKYSGWHKQETIVFSGQEGVEALLGLKFGNYAWNKLYRRELWTPDVRYPKDQLFEDVRTTYKILQKCQTVVAIPELKYYYRRHGGGIVDVKQLKNKIQAIEAHIERFNLIADNYPEQRAYMLKQIYWHLMPLRNLACNQSADSIKEFQQNLKPISEFLRCHIDEMMQAFGFGRLGRLSYYFATCGTKLGYQLSAKVDGLSSCKKKLSDKIFKNKLKPRINKIKWLGKLSYYYKWCLHLPLRKTIFIESRSGEDLAGNMLQIAYEACKRNLKVYLSVNSNYLDKVRRILESNDFPGLEIVIRQSRKYYKALGCSKYWFIDMTLDYDAIKRPGQIFVNTWHGTPLKMLEFDVKNKRHKMGGGVRDLLKCNYLAVPSRFLFEKLLSSSNAETLFNGEALFCGYPRNSIFFNRESAEKIRAEKGIDDKEVFAYMPTWRGPTSANIYNEYSLKKILDFFELNLKENQIIFVNLHNYTKEQIDYAEYRKVYPFPADIDTYSMLNAADCLITDYSSVLFDYANTRKKIVLFPYDYLEYKKERDLYFELENMPFPKVYNFHDLSKELNIDKVYDDTEFVQMFCAYDCHNSAQKLLAAVIDGDSACETLAISHDAKKNILIYDAMVTKRLLDDSLVRDTLANVDTDAANYFYCYRQDILEKTPKYLQELPEGIRIFTLTDNIINTLGERIAAKIFHGSNLKAKSQRELAKQFNGKRFDDIIILDENEYDPFCGMLKDVFAD